MARFLVGLAPSPTLTALAVSPPHCRRRNLMPRLVLTAHLAHVGGQELTVAGATLREALESAFAQRPGLRGYVLDDQGGLRHHVVAFIDGQLVRDKQRLDDPVPANGEVYLLQ